MHLAYISAASPQASTYAEIAFDQMQLHADLEVVDGALAGSMLDKVIRLPYISPISRLYLPDISRYLAHISPISPP